MTYLHLSPTAVPFSVSRKRLRSATDEDGRAAKRKEIGWNVPDVQTRCTAIHKAIKAMPDKNLSDPSSSTDLPCPSLLSMPYQRFASKKIDGVAHFGYMGRLQFHELQKRIKKSSFLDGSETLSLYGTSGSGKSHLLAALAYHLIREGERVFYIPDCYSLLLDPLQTMRDACHFAYYDSPVLGTIGHPDDVDALIRFLALDRDVYIIVDQVNALEFIENDRRKEKKVQVSDWLDALRFRHRYIFSASANEDSNREAYMKQRGISVIPTFGGMSPVRCTFRLFHTILIPCRKKPISGLSSIAIKFHSCHLNNGNASNISRVAFRFCYVALSNSPTLTNSNSGTFLIWLMSHLMSVNSLEASLHP